jgi:hypothetical protein
MHYLAYLHQLAVNQASQFQLVLDEMRDQDDLRRVAPSSGIRRIEPALRAV